MDLPSEPAPAHEQVIQQKLVECGLAPAGISVTYEDDLQGYVIVIGPEAGATTEHFQCIRAASGWETVTFTDSERYRQYLDFLAELSRPEVLKRAEEELARQGRLQGFPVRASFENDKLFAEALEVHCGLEKGSTIRPFDRGLAFQPPMEDVRDFGAFAKKYSCLMAAIAFVGAKQELSVAFIGNEAPAAGR